MTPRSIVLDAGFIQAVADADAPGHADAVRVYRELVDGYVARTNRLFALSTVLAAHPTATRRGLFAPVEVLYVSRRHRSDSARVGAVVSADMALVLVVMDREKIRCVATLGHDFDAFDLEIITPAPMPAAGPAPGATGEAPQEPSPTI